MSDDQHDSLEDRLRHLLPHPIHDSSQDGTGLRLIAGDPPLVIVEITGTTCVIRAYTARWSSSRVIEPLGELVGEAAAKDTEKLTALIRRAMEHRRAAFRTCHSCRTATPPEHMHNAELCAGCAGHA
jgi:hypothetical protein